MCRRKGLSILLLSAMAFSVIASGCAKNEEKEEVKVDAKTAGTLKPEEVKGEYYIHSVGK